MSSVTGSTLATGAGGASDSLGNFTAGASVPGEQATRSAPALAPTNRRRVRIDMTISADPPAHQRHSIECRKLYPALIWRDSSFQPDNRRRVATFEMEARSPGAARFPMN